MLVMKSLHVSHANIIQLYSRSWYIACFHTNRVTVTQTHPRSQSLLIYVLADGLRLMVVWVCSHSLKNCLFGVDIELYLSQSIALVCRNVHLRLCCLFSWNCDFSLNLFKVRNENLILISLTSYYLTKIYLYFYLKNYQQNII